MLDSSSIKKTAAGLGALLCGIASADSFTGAPEGHHPRDILSSCRSVVVLARRFSPSTLKANSTSPYTVVRNDLSAEMNHLAVGVADFMETEGFDAVPIGSIGPDDYDAPVGRFRGTISLKHAAQLAGMGKIGKNTLLVNDKYGNMIWLSAALTSAVLEPDPPASYEPCIPSCRICIDNCPVHALDGEWLDQKACAAHAFGSKNGGDWKIHCFTCRKTCPNCLGMKKAKG